MLPKVAHIGRPHAKPPPGSDGHESYYSDDFIAKGALKNHGIVRQGLAEYILISENVSPITDFPPEPRFGTVPSVTAHQSSNMKPPWKPRKD
jgi:hypothetical protein